MATISRNLWINAEHFQSFPSEQSLALQTFAVVKKAERLASLRIQHSRSTSSAWYRTSYAVLWTRFSDSEPIMLNRESHEAIDQATIYLHSRKSPSVSDTATSLRHNV
jgi:hypothetical protein